MFRRTVGNKEFHVSLVAEVLMIESNVEVNGNLISIVLASRQVSVFN